MPTVPPRGASEGEAIIPGQPGTESAWLAALCVVQFFHWFKPSEPELYEILSDVLHLDRHQILDEVFAWSVYWEPLSYLGCFAVYMVGGYRHALVLVTFLNLVTVALVLVQVELQVNTGSWFILASFYELTWTGGFTMLFVVSASSYDVLPKSYYQVATSTTRCAALVSTVTSSLLGTAMAVSFGKVSTLYVSLASSFLSLAALIYALYNGYMPTALHSTSHGDDPSVNKVSKEEDAAAPPSLSKMSKMYEALRSMRWLNNMCYFWMMIVSVTLAVHIVVLTQIQGLMHEHFEQSASGQSTDIYGVIQGGAYLVAVVTTLLPVYFQLCGSAPAFALVATAMTSALILWYSVVSALILWYSVRQLSYSGIVYVSSHTLV
jgi:hypothetical protein